MVTATDSSIGRSPHHRTRLKRLGADTLADGRSFVGGLFYTDWITLVLLSPAATQSLALIVHELCTNATKYGAYSTPGGRVAVRWSIEQTGNEPACSVGRSGVALEWSRNPDDVQNVSHN